MSDDPLSQIIGRMDKQDVILKDIQEKLLTHLVVDKEMKPALDELVALWRGSKLLSAIILSFAMIVGSIWGVFVWANDHIK